MGNPGSAAGRLCLQFGTKKRFIPAIEKHQRRHIVMLITHSFQSSAPSSVTLSNQTNTPPSGNLRKSKFFMINTNKLSLRKDLFVHFISNNEILHKIQRNAVADLGGRPWRALPPTAQNFLNFMQFFANFGKISLKKNVGAPCRFSPPPTGNPGSAPER